MVYNRLINKVNSGSKYLMQQMKIRLGEVKKSECYASVYNLQPQNSRRMRAIKIVSDTNSLTSYGVLLNLLSTILLIQLI